MQSLSFRHQVEHQSSLCTAGISTSVTPAWSQGREAFVSLKPTHQDPGARCQVSGLTSGTSLEVHWVSFHLSVQGTKVQSLVWEDPTRCGATKPERYNYWSPCTESPQHAPQKKKKKKRAPQWEALVLSGTREEPPVAATRQSLSAARRPSTAENKIKIKAKTWLTSGPCCVSNSKL